MFYMFFDELAIYRELGHRVINILPPKYCTHILRCICAVYKSNNFVPTFSLQSLRSNDVSAVSGSWRTWTRAYKKYIN